MATDQRNVLGNLVGDAELRSWGSAVSAQLAACGLVQTADTGQINWATVTKPAAGATPAGYEIWRFNDALQATKPVFIKVEYGTGGAATFCAMWLTVGTGTNGAGTLSGQLFARVQVAGGTQPAAGVTVASFCSGNGSGIRLANLCTVGQVSQLLAWGVERPRRIADGTYSDIGYYAWALSANGTSVAGLVPFIGGIPNRGAGFDSIIMSGNYGGLSNLGGNVVFNPAFIVAGELFVAPIWRYRDTDVGPQVAVPLDCFGAIRQVMPLGNATQNQNMNSDTSCSTAFLWE